MPFLDEEEWNQVSPLLADAIQAIKSYREEHKCDLATARANCKPEATKTFFKMTGVDGVHFDTINHHRRLNWGPECKKCGHLFRTSQASFCANCGYEENNNAVE